MDNLCFDLQFAMLVATELYVGTGVGGCGWTIYAREVHIEFAFWQFLNNPPYSNSVAESTKL